MDNDVVEIPISPLMGRATLKVRVVCDRRFRVRVWLAQVWLDLGCRILGVGYTFVDEEDG